MVKPISICENPPNLRHPPAHQWWPWGQTMVPLKKGAGLKRKKSKKKKTSSKAYIFRFHGFFFRHKIPLVTIFTRFTSCKKPRCKNPHLSTRTIRAQFQSPGSKSFEKDWFPREGKKWVSWWSTTPVFWQTETAITKQRFHILLGSSFFCSCSERP